MLFAKLKKPWQRMATALHSRVPAAGPAIEQPADRNMLFVCGAPRSGTTGLWRLLVQDPRIVLGMERHGSRLGKKVFSACLYDRAGFFDFTAYPNAARVAHPYYEEEARARFDTAVYIGDKLPLLFRKYDVVTRVFPAAKTVVLLRNILDICESYQARLEDPADSWTFDVADAVTHWNGLLGFLAQQRGNPRIKVLVYEHFLSDAQAYRDLYDFLGLAIDEGFESRYATMLEGTERLRLRRKPRVDEAQKLAILRAANWALYAQELKHQSPSPAS
jgi:hypothetical protein